MKTNIFVNVAVKDLEKSKAFWSALGYSFNPQFTNETGACMMIDENIFSMLVTEEFFKKLTKRELADSRKAVSTATCITLETKEKVDEWANKALSLGATENNVPEMKVEDFMYGRSLNDLDGHIWEVMWMNSAAIQKSH